MQFIKALIVLFSLSFSATTLMAQTLHMPGHSAASTQKLPDRGSTMQQVEQEFGFPASVIESVGEPPITQWLYAGFRVYFENDHVIHCVDTETMVMPQ